MWDLPGSGIEPMIPALVGGFFTTELPGKPCNVFFFFLLLLLLTVVCIMKMSIGSGKCKSGKIRNIASWVLGKKGLHLLETLSHLISIVKKKLNGKLLLF